MDKRLTRKFAESYQFALMERAIIGRSKSSLGKNFEDAISENISVKMPGLSQLQKRIVLQEEKILIRSVLYAPITIFDVPASVALRDIALTKMQPGSHMVNTIRAVDHLVPQSGIYEFCHHVSAIGHDLKSEGWQDAVKKEALSATDGFCKVIMICNEKRIGYSVLKDANKKTVFDNSDVEDEFRPLIKSTIGQCVYLRDEQEIRESATLGNNFDTEDMMFLLYLVLMAVAYHEHLSSIERVIVNQVRESKIRGSRRRITISAHKTVSFDLGGETEVKFVNRICREVIRRQGVKEHEVSLHWRHFGGDLKCEHRFEAVEGDDGIARQKCVHCGMRRSKIKPFLRGNPELGVAVRVTKVTDSRRTK